MKKIALAFFFFAAYLSVLQFSTPNIIGFDGYSHAKTAELIMEKGFFDDFIWLPFTSIGTGYADIQVLFHILLIPFNSEFGVKIAAVLFSAIFFALFYWFLERNKIKHGFLYSLLLLVGSTELTYRFLLARPFVLGLACFALVLYFMHRKMYKSLASTFLVYSLLYSGFIFGLLAVIVYFLVNLYYKKVDYKILIYSFLGTGVGLIINPYFPSNISFLFMQWFQVNLAGNLFNQEWRAWPLLDLLKFSWLFLALFFTSLFFVIKRKLFNINNLFYLILSGLFFVALISSRRFLEYFAPLSIILFAFVLKDQLENFIKNKPIKNLILFLIFILTIFNLVAVRQDVINNDFLHRFDDCVAWANENIPENSLIFNNAYTFNYLFYNNADLRYTHGLDLTYSFLQDKEKFGRYMNALQGHPVKGNIVVEDYDADYVFIGKVKQDVDLFDYINQHSGDFDLQYNDLDCTILEVKK